MSRVQLETAGFEEELEGEHYDEEYFDDGEVTDSSSENDDGEERPCPPAEAYKSQSSATAIKIRNTQLTYAEAKLYGMLDENGNIKMKHQKAHQKKEEVCSFLMMSMVYANTIYHEGCWPDKQTFLC